MLEDWKTGERCGYLMAFAVSLSLAACGGGSSSTTASSTPMLTPPGPPLVRVSAPSPYGVNCGGAMQGSVSYEDAEVEPYMAVNPADRKSVV